MEWKTAESPAGAAPTTIDIGRIMQMIPHRYPFLMIERLVNVVPNASATSIMPLR